MEYQDYYAVLDVPREADEKKVRDAYRKLARKYHPDVNPGDKTAEAKFKQINEAYEVLSNKEKRQKYDTLGANWEQIERDEELRRRYAAENPGRGGGPQTGGPQTGGDFSDFFSTFFGGGRRQEGGFWEAFSGGGVGGEALDLEAALTVTLEEAAKGTTRRLQLEVDDVCSQCGGSGMIAGESKRQSGGRIAINARPCPTCRGQGVVSGQRTVNARIPPGATEGTRLRLAGQGARGPRGDNGDLILRVHLAPHPIFSPKERDLHCELPVWDFEAALGAQVDAPTLDGLVRVKVPAGSQSGQSLRLRGKGLPGRGNAAAGDLLLTLKVVIPTGLDDEEKKLFGDLQERVNRRHPSPRDELLRRAE
jgi:DnaJ-class molecular chaperone